MWQETISFFNSNFFVALATLFVGGFAIYLYKRQKADSRRDAANVILAEIRQAERMIDEFKNNGIGNDVVYKLLPSNNWIKHNYLFINDLDSDEIDQINSFYNQCFVLDRTIDQNHISHELANKSVAIHQTLSVIAKESNGNKVFFDQAKKNYLDLILDDGYAFRPDATLRSINKALNNIRFITTSTVGAKLKKIAKIK